MSSNPMAAVAARSQSPNDVITKWRTVRWYNVHDGTSRRLRDALSSDPSISSWTATKWLGSDFCLPQVPEGGSYEPNEPPLRTGLLYIDVCVE